MVDNNDQQVNSASNPQKTANEAANEIIMQSIATVHSPYKQKFAIPRQPGLVSAAYGRIELLGECNNIELLRNIEQHSHLWVIFIFHATQNQGWKPLIKAPRLGGNKKTGVFSSRSTFRPNPIGMSVVKFEGVSKRNNSLYIEISGLDILDGTPVLDIKPYIPYSDSLAEARSQFASSPEDHQIQIRFNQVAQQQVNQLQREYPKLALFIEQVLQQDPRPAYKKLKTDKQEYGMSLYDLNIRWQIQDQDCQIISINKVTGECT